MRACARACIRACVSLKKLRKYCIPFDKVYRNVTESSFNARPEEELKKHVMDVALCHCKMQNKTPWTRSSILRKIDKKRGLVKV